MSESPELISITIKWSGKEISLEDVSLTSTVVDLKDLIADKTNVLPDRQKLLNLRFKGQLKGFNYVSFDAFGGFMEGLVHIEPTFIDNPLLELYQHCSSSRFKRSLTPGAYLLPLPGKLRNGLEGQQAHFGGFEPSRAVGFRP